MYMKSVNKFKDFFYSFKFNTSKHSAHQHHVIPKFKQPQSISTAECRLAYTWAQVIE